MAFNAEVITETLSIKATAALTAGDPVTAAGAKAVDAAHFIGVASSDAAIGDVISVITEGLVALDLGGASGVSAGDPVTINGSSEYAELGIGTHGIGLSFNSVAAGGAFRMKIKPVSITA